MPISDEEVKQVLFGQNVSPATQPSVSTSSGITDEQVARELFAPAVSEPTAGTDVPMEVPTEEASPISLSDRLRLSFADDRGREAELRKKFSYVEKGENGKFQVGNDPRALTPIDPEGVFNDVLGDLADVVGEIPVIAGQIIGTSAGATAGAAAGGIGAAPGAVAGAAGGSLVGEGIRKGIGKALGVNEQDAKEIATDMAISTAFGAAGEALAVGTRVFGKRVLAPKLTSMLAKIDEEAKSTGKATTFQNGISKVFKFLANVPEESTRTFSKYGWKEMDNPAHFDKNAILGLVDNAVTNLDQAAQTLGKEVGNQKSQLAAAAGRMGSEGRVATEDLFKVLRIKAQELDILDGFGKINKDYPNPEEVKPILALLREFGTIENGSFVPEAGKTIPMDKALRLSSSFGQKFEKVTPRVQQAFDTVLNGDVNIGVEGLRPRITKFANKIGLTDYAKANENFSRFITLRNTLSTLDTKAPVGIENFISRMENLGSIPRRDLYELEKYTSKPFIKEWELWNAAQDFKKAEVNNLRFLAVASIIGSATGLNTRENRLGTFAGAALLGTPAGLRMLIRGTNRAGSVFTKQTLQKIGEKTVEGMDSRAAAALLSRLIQRKATATNNKGQGQENK